MSLSKPGEQLRCNMPYTYSTGLWNCFREMNTIRPKDVPLIGGLTMVIKSAI